MTEPSVVVAVDGSDSNSSALVWAIEEARRSGSPLTVATVAEPWQVVGPYVPELPERDFAQPVADRAAAHASELLPAGRVSTDVRTGHPVRVLQEVAEGQRLLVVGKRGLGALGRLLIGSTSIAVAGRAGLPVVVVPDDFDAEASTGRPVVLGLDIDAPHRAALRYALAESARRNARLVVVQAWEPPGVLVTDPDLAADVFAGWRTEGRRALEEVVGRAHQEFPDVDVSIEQSLGFPVHVLVEAAEDAQLLVVGRDAKERLSGFSLGSVGRGVLHHCTVPVAVIPAAEV